MALRAGFDKYAVCTMSTEAGHVSGLLWSWIAPGAMLAAADTDFVHHRICESLSGSRHGGAVEMEI